MQATPASSVLFLDEPNSIWFTSLCQTDFMRIGCGRIWCRRRKSECAQPASKVTCVAILGNVVLGMKGEHERFAAYGKNASNGNRARSSMDFAPPHVGARCGLSAARRFLSLQPVFHDLPRCRSIFDSAAPGQLSFDDRLQRTGLQHHPVRKAALAPSRWSWPQNGCCSNRRERFGRYLATYPFVPCLQSSR